MIDCDELIEKKGLREVESKKKGEKQEQGRRNREEKTFHGLGLPLLVNRITTALECGHPLFEERLINNYFFETLS